MQRVVGACLVLVTVVFVAWPKRHDAPRAAVETAPATEPSRIVEQPHFASVTPRAMSLPPLRRAAHMSGPGVIAGDVVDHGNPVGGATVYRIPLALPGRSAPYVSTVEVAADEDGHFRLIDVPPGDYAIYAVFEKRASALLMPITIAPGESQDGLELEIIGPSVAEGIVVDENGNRVEASVDASVRGIELTTSIAMQHESFLFDELPCEPITLHASGGLPDREDNDEARMTMLEPTSGIVMRLGKPTPNLTVEVSDETGAPAQGASVQVLFDSDSDNGITDETGIASFTHVFGHLRIVAEEDSRELASDPVVVDVREDEPRHVRVVLRDSPCSKGRVIDADGKPAVGFITLEQIVPRTLTMIMLESDGTYSACVGRAGRYHVSYEPFSHEHAAEVGTVAAGFDVEPGRRELPDIRLPRTRTIRGTLLDDEGKPADHGTIYAYSLTDGNELGGANVIDGHFTLKVMGDVGLVGREIMGASKLVEARGTSDEEITLAVEAIGTIEVLLRGAPAGARARCGTASWEFVSSAGQSSVSCHPSDVLEIVANDEHRRFPVTVAAGESSYVELRWD